ncbi:MAG: helix-turn-helix transcriptional regulator [Aquabacterium sp.]
MLNILGMERAARGNLLPIDCVGVGDSMLAPAYHGPERRHAGSLAQRRMAQMLDAIDYGMLLLSDHQRLLHVNTAARRDLDDTHPLQLQGGQLQTRLPEELPTLQAAMKDAGTRGLRRLLRLGGEDGAATVAVVPLAPLGADQRCAVLLVLGKRRMCEELTVDWFARAHHLTRAETQVLKLLTQDLTPQEVAQQLGVGLATVRSQIGAIRSKTGSDSIRSLVRQVAVLPPLVGALGLSTWRGPDLPQRR